MGEKEKETSDPVDKVREDATQNSEATDQAQEGQEAGNETQEALRERYLRLAAEFDNYRKRQEREMAEFKRRAADDLLLAVLDVMDNMDRALEGSDECDPRELVDGMRAIRNQVGAILQREGIEAIESVGRPFDPFEMEAVMRMPSEQVDEGDVVRELQGGYKARGYVLRPAKVIVSSGPPGPEGHEEGPGKGPQEDDEVSVTVRK